MPSEKNQKHNIAKLMGGRNSSVEKCIAIKLCI